MHHSLSLPSGVYIIDHIQVVDVEGKKVSYKVEALIVKTLNLPSGTKVEIPTSSFEEAITTLWNYGYAVEINADILQNHHLGLQVIILKRYPKISFIHWYGITEQEEKELTAHMPCSEGKPFLPHLQESIEAYIEGYFRKKGFRYSQASLEVKSLKKNKIKLDIYVKKEKQYHMGHINFNIKKPYDSYELAQYLPYSRQGTLPAHNAWYERTFQNMKRGYLAYILQDALRVFKFSTPFFDEEKIKEEARKLEDDYKKKGFLDAAVYYDLEDKGDLVNVTFDIDLGEPYTIAKVTWEGNVLLSETALNEGLNLYPGRSYHLLEIAQLLVLSPYHTTIHTLYEQSKAPVWVSAQIRIKGKEGSEVYLEGYVQESRYPKITQVDIHTAGKVNPAIVKTILAEHDIVAGQELTRENIIACERRLAATGFFHTETISLVPLPTGPNQVRIDCHLIESRTIDFDAGLDGYKFKVAVEEQNFDFQKLLRGKLPTGGGQKVAAHISFNEFSSVYLGGSFANPWVTMNDQRTPIGFQVFRKCQEGKGADFQFNIHASQPHQKPYPYDYSCKLTYGREQVDTIYYPIPSVDTCVLQAAYEKDGTDDPYYPTAGHKVYTVMKGTYLVNNNTNWHKSYLQWLGQYKYFRTGEPYHHTFNYTLTGGVALNGSSRIPLNKMILGDSPFAMPASKLVQPSLLPFRGYRDVTTLDTYAGCSHYGFTQSFELRYRLWERPLVYGLVFFDTAFTDNHCYATVGAEIRVLTPVCIVSGYVYYPSPKGHLGLRMRLMLNE